MVILIKRWQVTSSGKPLVLYGDTSEEIREKWNCVDKDCEIIPYENDEYIDVIDKIKGRKRGLGVVLCMYDKPLWLNERTIALPVEYV